MINPNKAFSVASDEALVELISSARRRLVVIAPAMTEKVAKAVAKRLDNLENLEIKVILDSDPEVYRLGYGDIAALETIQIASRNNMFDLRQQAGVRIGLVISDDTVMVYSPVCQNIEAGSTSVEKPNAIILTGSATDHIATAAGADMSENAPDPEIGEFALKPDSVEKMQANLKENPPRPFDITRRLKVFSSKVQYVEFSASNYRLTTRQIPLPPELITVADENLKSRINSRIRGPFDEIGEVGVTIKDDDNKEEKLKVNDIWLQKERKRIEDAFTFQVNNFGRLIFRIHRDKFDKAVKRFEAIVQNYQSALQNELCKKQEQFEAQIIKEFSDAWTKAPPERFKLWGIEPTQENIKNELRKVAKTLFENATAFIPPVVKTIYKDIALENIQNPDFLDALVKVMKQKQVPEREIESLFESGVAAPESNSFLKQ